MHLCHASGPLIKYLFVSEISSKYEKVEALSKALLELPPSHYETLKYLLGHLYRYANSSINGHAPNYNVNETSVFIA